MKSSSFQMVSRRSTIAAFLKGPLGQNGAMYASLSRYTNCTGNKQKSQTLKDLFEDLEVDTCAIRYRRRSLERRPALSTLHHPHFDPPGDGVGAIDSSTTARVPPETRHALEKEINHFLTADEDLIIMETSNLLTRKGESARMAEKGTSGVKANFGLTKRISDTSDEGSIAGKNAMPSRTLHLFKGASFSGVGNSMWNPESLRKVSSENNLQNSRRNNRFSSGLIMLSQLSQRLRQTTSFLSFYSKKEEGDEIQREGIKGGEEVNVLLQTMRRNDSRNLLNALPRPKKIR